MVIISIYRGEHWSPSWLGIDWKIQTLCAASTKKDTNMNPAVSSRVVIWLFVVCLGIAPDCVAADIAKASFQSHRPTRPLPQSMVAAKRNTRTSYVDPVRGNDDGEGCEPQPWKTLKAAFKKLQPGDTLYLRGGVYYEKVAFTKSGTSENPITIASYPGETAIIDGGLREFVDSPAICWQPLEGGAEGEYVSTKTFDDVDARRVPTQFLPGSWEPMWGIEDDRPLALGNFADSMVPLHGYRMLVDLRAANELWVANKKDRDVGIYCGPGLWFNRETGRIHIRLAHHQLEGLGKNAYRGETDPRKLPLVISLGFGEDVLRVTGIKHVRLQGLVFRGATGSPMISVYGSDNIELDHVTVFGGFPGLMINASQNIRVKHSAFRGLAAPWTSRAHMKYRGTPTYQIVLQNGQPLNENIELSWSEFTDDHDFAFLRWVKNLQFHHNFVDNFNDDGFECGPKLRNHTIFISENRVGGVLSPFTQHETDKDESPIDHNPKAGVFVFRNVFDLRAGSYVAPPTKPDPSGAFLKEEGHLASDHGSPVWAVMHVYHNTFMRESPIFRDNFLFGLAVGGLRQTERDVFNNIFVQAGKVPGVNFIAMKQAEHLREGGNVLWGQQDGPKLQGDPFAKFRASPLFKDSRQHYEPGWTTHDRIADPKFVRLTFDAGQSSDLRLQADSPAINTGVAVPAEWPDPLRSSDADQPDVGAVPFGADAWSVGVDGRFPLFGGAVAAERR